MVKISSFVTTALALAVALVVLFASEIDAKGGRGGRSGGGRSYRSSRTSRSRSGGSSSSTWKALAISGALYGGLRYQTRSRYRANPNSRPTICENYSAKDSNGTTYGMFICPMWDDVDEKDYCCGPHNEQYCCTFWDDSGRMAGAIVGFVIAGLVTIGLIACIVKCCCCSDKKQVKTEDAPAVHYQSNPPGKAQDQAYPQAPTDNPPAYGFKDPNYTGNQMVQPPAYDESFKY